MRELRGPIQQEDNQAEQNTLLLPDYREQILRIQSSQQVITGLLESWEPTPADIYADNFIQPRKYTGLVQAGITDRSFLEKQGILDVEFQHPTDGDINGLGEAYGMPDSDTLSIQGYYNNSKDQQRVDQAVADNQGLKHSLYTFFLLDKRDIPQATRIKKISYFRMVQEESPLTPEDLAVMEHTMGEIERRLLETSPITPSQESPKPVSTSRTEERWQSRVSGAVIFNKTRKLLTGE